jgi:hypothetical protein
VRAPVVLLISTIAHGVVIALVADWATPLQRKPVRAAPQTARELVAEPIEIAFVDDPEPIAVVAAGASGHRANPASISTSRGAAAIPSGTNEAATTEATTSANTSATGTNATKSGLMHMRGADLRLDAGTAERIASAPQPRRDELKKSGKLESTPGGGAVVHDRVTTLTVDPDGKAHFDDKPDIDVHFHLPIPKLWKLDEMRQDLGHELTEWFKDPEAGKRYGRTQDLPRHLQASPGACDSWAGTMCDDPLAPRIDRIARERKKVQGGVLGGWADITAYLHRKFVGDPYSSRKLELLDDTRDERVAMGTSHRKQQAVRSAEYMTRNLETLWTREPRPIARRAALFELWDECGEDDAGLRARAVVIGWIRAKLPAGSADAYTDEEVHALQARRTSTAAFAPYE